MILTMMYLHVRMLQKIKVDVEICHNEAFIIQTMQVKVFPIISVCSVKIISLFGNPIKRPQSQTESSAIK
jgi:hypothetical protein